MMRPTRYILTLIVCGALVVVGALTAGASYAVILSQTYRLYDQKAAEYYASDELKYSQLSCFIAEDAYFGTTNIDSAHDAYDKALQTASLSTDNEHIRLYIDAYSCEGEINIKTPDEELLSSSFNAAVTAVGGDFFALHRLDFVSGQAFGHDDENRYRVVLDELAAWRLYGAVDITGMLVDIDGRLFEIAGVVESEDYSYYGIVPRIYMQYDVWSEINDNDAITCYEVLLPEPIDGFGYDTLSGAVKSLGDDVEIKVNSTRYDIFELAERVTETNKRGTRTNEIYYPHWENNALERENACIGFAVAIIVSGVIAAVAVVTAVSMSLMRLTAFITEYKEKHRI